MMCPWSYRVQWGKKSQPISLNIAQFFPQFTMIFGTMVLSQKYYVYTAFFVFIFRIRNLDKAFAYLSVGN